MHALVLTQDTTTTTTTTSVNGAAVAVMFLIILVASIVLSGLCFYGIFKKAGQPTWAAFVPIVNFFYVLKIIGRPAWWFLGLLVPCVSLIVLIVMMNDLSKSFGKDVGFTVGLVLLNAIFLLILSYGSAQYRGPAGLATGGYQPAVP